MKNNKLLKISLIIITIISIVCITGIANAANDAKDAFPGELIGKSSAVSNNVSGYASTILGVVQVIGYSVAVIILAWLGVKYIMASPDGKAEIKKQAFAYLLGAVLLFAAGSIVGWIRGAINENSNGSGNSNTSGYIQVIDESKC